MIALVFSINSFFPEFDLYASLLIAYIGLIFAGMYFFEGNKAERLLAAFLFTLFGAILSFSYIYGVGSSSVQYPTIMAVISLMPAILLTPIVYLQEKTSLTMRKFIAVYSSIASIIACLIIFVKVLQNIDFTFAIFILPGFLMVLSAFFQ